MRLTLTKIRKYRADYNDNPFFSVAFMPTIASTSGRLHSEFVRLLFLQAHGETRSSSNAIHQWPVPQCRRRTCVVQITHSPITLANLSFINLVYVFRCYSSPHHPVYVRLVHPSGLVFSLSSHRHSSISLPFSFRFIN